MGALHGALGTCLEKGIASEEPCLRPTETFHQREMDDVPDPSSREWLKSWVESMGEMDCSIILKTAQPWAAWHPVSKGSWHSEEPLSSALFGKELASS